jgi:protein SCO1
MSSSGPRKVHQASREPQDAKVERRRVAVVLGISALVAVPTALLVQSRSHSIPSPFKLIDITGAGYAGDFRLLDHNGVPRSLKDFKGEVVVVFFGFTQCPDVCPTTLAEIVQAKKLMGPDGVKLRAIFVTVDPERDNPQVLKSYMANFDPAFVALRPDAGQLEQLVQEFKIHIRKNAGQSPTSYTLDHTAASFVYDPRGRLRLYARYAAGAEALASDAKLLLSGA